MRTAALFAAAVTTANVVSSPSPPPLKTIINITSHPLCSTVRERIAPALQLEATNNAVVARSLPTLGHYNDDLRSGMRDNAYFDVYKLETMANDLKRNNETLRALVAEAPSTPGPSPAGSGALQSPDEDAALVAQTRDGLRSVLSQQESSERAIRAFVDQEIFGADMTSGRNLMAASKASNTAAAAAEAQSGGNGAETLQAVAMDHQAPVSYVPITPYAHLIAVNSQNILDEEHYLHGLVGVIVDRCYRR